MTTERRGGNRRAIAIYTAGVLAARAAYRADQTAEQGVCVTCERRDRHGDSRECWKCRLVRTQRVNAARKQRQRDREASA